MFGEADYLNSDQPAYLGAAGPPTVLPPGYGGPQAPAPSQRNQTGNLPNGARHGMMANDPNILPGGAGGGLNGSAAAPVPALAMTNGFPQGAAAPGYGAASTVQGPPTGLYAEAGPWVYLFYAPTQAIQIRYSPTGGQQRTDVPKGSPQYAAIYDHIMRHKAVGISEAQLNALPQPTVRVQSPSQAAANPAAPSATAQSAFMQLAASAQQVIAAARGTAGGGGGGFTASPYSPASPPADASGTSSGGYTPWILGGVAVAAAAAALYYFTRKPKAETRANPEPEESEEEAA